MCRLLFPNYGIWPYARSHMQGVCEEGLLLLLVLPVSTSMDYIVKSGETLLLPQPEPYCFA